MRILPRPAFVGPVLFLALLACGSPDASPSDAGIDATTMDASLDSSVDAGPRDAGQDAALDAGVDAEFADAEPLDAAPADAGNDAAGSCAPCSWGSFSSVGTVTPSPGTSELSGLAVSKTRPDVIYTHNDSGDTARFFALHLNGQNFAEYTLTGVNAVDFEDIATGPCGPDLIGSCVFLADIGDNALARSSLKIYRVPEPAGGSQSVTSTAITFTYPNGPHDSESLFMDETGALYVVTKETHGASTVFTLGVPHGNATTVATQVGVLPAFNLGLDLPSRVTAADYFPSPGCPRLAFRTYGSVEVFTGQPGDTIAALIRRPRATLGPILTETQGESVAFSPSGLELYSVSEGANVPLDRSQCR